MQHEEGDRKKELRKIFSGGLAILKEMENNRIAKRVYKGSEWGVVLCVIREKGELIH